MIKIIPTLVLFAPTQRRKLFKGISEWLKRLILLPFFFYLAACSNSDPINGIIAPDLIKEANFAFIADDQLYEYDSELKTTKKLVDLRGSVFTPIDADESAVEESFEEEAVTYRDAYPEFLVYKMGQDLLAFEFSTRTTHTLYSFDSPSNPNGSEYICDLRTPIYPDLEAGKRNELLAINQRAVYVKTSPSEDCANTQGYRYYLMPIEENGENYLLTKFSKKENSTFTQSYPYYQANKETASEAEMYAREIIPNFESDQYATYGMDSTTKEMVLYTASADDPSSEKIELWRVFGDDFDIEAENYIARTQPHSLLLSDHAPTKMLNSNTALLIENGWSISLFDKDSLFDDDASLTRENALATPLVNRSIPAGGEFQPAQFVRNANSREFFVLDDFKVFNLSFGVTDSVTSANLDTLASGYELTLSAGIPVLSKRDNANETALISISNGIESTVYPRTSMNIMLMNQISPMAALINEYDDTQFKALAFSSTDSQVELENAFFVSASDNRYYPDHDQGPTFSPVVVNKTTDLNGQDRFTISTLLNEGKGLELIDENLAWTSETLLPHSDNRVELINDTFALVKVMTETDTGTALRYFYFNPIDKILERPTPFDPLPELEAINLPE